MLESTGGQHSLEQIKGNTWHLSLNSALISIPTDAPAQGTESVGEVYQER